MSDPLINALTAPQEHDTPGRTAKELAAEIGSCTATVLDRLRVLQGQGKLKVHRVPRQAIDGRMLHTTTYELVDADSD